MFYVYILRSLKDKKTYVGYTYELKQRLEKHTNGLVKSTKHRRPFKLLFTENFQTEKEAKKRELWWKSGAGRRKLKKYFNNSVV
jgi:putative endonuclease